MALIPYNGTMVTPDWIGRIELAQKELTYELEGQEFARIPYGQEAHRNPYLIEGSPCPDCAVLPGQLHVPGCDVEGCPKCGSQAISCFCEGEEGEK